jgi:hypothetical protein
VHNDYVARYLPGDSVNALISGSFANAGTNTFVASDPTPPAAKIADGSQQHGTACAGVALGNNDVGESYC